MLNLGNKSVRPLSESTPKTSFNNSNFLFNISIILINEEKDNKKFLEEFKTYQKDKYLNKQTIYHFLTINNKEKDLNDFAILKHDHKIIIQNLIFKGKYEEAFDYLEKNLGTGKSNIDEGIKAFMKYFDIFMKKSVKNTIRLLENINFSKNDAKQVINAIMGTAYEKCIKDIKNIKMPNMPLFLDNIEKAIKEKIHKDTIKECKISKQRRFRIMIKKSVSDTVEKLRGMSLSLSEIKTNHSP